MVDESAFNSLAGRIGRALEEHAEKAPQSETEIIKVARELGLSPKTCDYDKKRKVTLE